ncbi:hypothetical protein Hanom_Chr03g00263061 [Helianthus anomalus]
MLELVGTCLLVFQFHLYGLPQHNCDSGSCLCTYQCGFHQPESGITISCLN